MSGDIPKWLVVLVAIMLIIITVMPFAMFALSGPHSNANSNKPIRVEMYLSHTQTNWTFKVAFLAWADITTTPTLSISDVHIRVTGFDDSGNKTGYYCSVWLFILKSGNYFDGIKFINVGDSNLLDQGDYLIVDRTLCPSGILSLEDGHNYQYCARPFW